MSQDQLHPACMCRPLPKVQDAARESGAGCLLWVLTALNGPTGLSSSALGQNWATRASAGGTVCRRRDSARLPG